ncbi:hypothetical protein ASPCAL12537 [Aspergillus calidoustus]|uniref:Uncharacterized protein n=1 Tax=Aspergillus calidoustus TaxID=454130 RepID=A0A0U5CG23_ASPCI|nr:hypothetical protein ASPCAL12537 [Aspergillus calidoustus]
MARRLPSMDRYDYPIRIGEISPEQERANSKCFRASLEPGVPTPQSRERGDQDGGLRSFGGLNTTRLAPVASGRGHQTFGQVWQSWGV